MLAELLLQDCHHRFCGQGQRVALAGKYPHPALDGGHMDGAREETEPRAPAPAHSVVEVQANRLLLLLAQALMCFVLEMPVYPAVVILRHPRACMALSKVISARGTCVVSRM